ncbi:sulfur transferase domain-containing protein [Trichocoleus desertorum AS-A10]|uniref:beta-lactamase hydrolase domain-containing protein n=1 Tax=Trichocoleus desertorum TaxID=1481672 RepID=UPI003296C68C
MVKPINQEFSAAGQVTPEELEQAAQAGFKSVLNVRSPEEQGFLNKEAQIVTSLGLAYANAPLAIATLDETQLAAIVTELDKLPKPTLIHCAGGLRASAVALLSIAQQEGLTSEQTIERAQAVGIDLDANPKLKQALEQAIANNPTVNS